jgi:hypothetical protein
LSAVERKTAQNNSNRAKDNHRRDAQNGRKKTSTSKDDPRCREKDNS